MSDYLQNRIRELEEENIGLKENNGFLSGQVEAMRNINQDLMGLLRRNKSIIASLLDQMKQRADDMKLAELLGKLTAHGENQKLINKLQQDQNEAIGIGNDALFLSESEHKRNEKYRIAPKVKGQKADEFWGEWKKKYDGYIKDGKEVSWALDKIKNELKTSGAWLKRTNNKSTCPDRTTVFRQMVGNRK